MNRIIVSHPAKLFIRSDVCFLGFAVSDLISFAFEWQSGWVWQALDLGLGTIYVDFF